MQQFIIWAYWMKQKNLGFSFLTLYIKYYMKNLKTSKFEIESKTTQEREKRFHRKNNNSSSRSKSKCSVSDSSADLSKFYVKKIMSKNIILTEKLSSSTHLINNDWTPPKREPTPCRSKFQKAIKESPTKQVDDKKIQIEYLQKQVSYFQNYTKKQENKLLLNKSEIHRLKKEKEDLHEEIVKQKNNNKQLLKQIQALKKEIERKKQLVQFYQKQKPSLKKVKGSIYVHKMEEFEEQKRELNQKIRELEDKILNATQNSINSPSKDFSSFLDRSIDEESTKQTFNQYVREIQQELHSAKGEICKLRIELDYQRAHSLKNLEVYKKKKTQEYNELKNKFSLFLGKYKQSSKRVNQIEINKLKRANSRLRQSSQESLTLSQGDE